MAVNGTKIENTCKMFCKTDHKSEWCEKAQTTIGFHQYIQATIKQQAISQPSIYLLGTFVLSNDWWHPFGELDPIVVVNWTQFPSLDYTNFH